MLHHMKLNPGPFEKITNGSKVIEIRLNDEKRRLLKIGDAIEFQLMNDETKKILTKIKDLSIFPSFKETFSAFPPHEYGSSSQDEYVKMYEIYSPEEEKRFGVLAIRIHTFQKKVDSNLSYNLGIPTRSALTFHQSAPILSAIAERLQRQPIRKRPSSTNGGES